MNTSGVHLVFCLIKQYHYSYNSHTGFALCCAGLWFPPCGELKTPLKGDGDNYFDLFRDGYHLINIPNLLELYKCCFLAHKNP